jgi:hypothetical protein
MHEHLWHEDVFFFVMMQSLQTSCFSNWGFILQMVHTTLTLWFVFCCCFFSHSVHSVHLSWFSVFLAPQTGHWYFNLNPSVHSLHMLPEVSLSAGLNLHMKQIFCSKDVLNWSALLKQDVHALWSLEAFELPQIPQISSFLLYSASCFRLSSFASRNLFWSYSF